MYHGDIRLGDTIDIKFTTVNTSGVPTTLAGTPVISAYPDNSVTELTAGITLTVDFDARTGMHNVRVVATGANGYATATNYALVITTGTVGGSSVVGYVVGTFSIENRLLNAAKIDTAAITAAKFGAGAVDATAFAQGAADKVWSSATRTLTAFSTALALSVWDVLETAILTASSIGLKLKNNLDAAITSRFPATGGTLAKTTNITGFNDVSTTDVKTQAVAALNTDTYAEPAQGAPAATVTLVTKIGFLYKAWRNRTTQTASQYSLYGDDSITIDHKATFSDDGTTADRAKVATGP